MKQRPISGPGWHSPHCAAFSGRLAARQCRIGRVRDGLLSLFGLPPTRERGAKSGHVHGITVVVGGVVTLAVTCAARIRAAVRWLPCGGDGKELELVDPPRIGAVRG